MSPSRKEPTAHAARTARCPATCPTVAPSSMTARSASLTCVSGEARISGWSAAGKAIIAGIEGALAAKKVTYDLARQMPGATEVPTSTFADAIIAHLK